jgi:hypothetical protein
MMAMVLHRPSAKAALDIAIWALFLAVLIYGLIT